MIDINDKPSIDLVENKKYIIENPKLCAVDTNIPVDVIEYVSKNFKSANFFLDTVSTSESKKVEPFIGFFHTIKPNKIESEMLSGVKIRYRMDLRKASEYFLNKGVKRVFKLLEKNGCTISMENVKISLLLRR